MTETNRIEIGRLLRASTSGCVVGCRVSQLTAPSFGCMVNIPLEGGYQVYGLVYDIHIDDDGLVRQLVTADGVPDVVLRDNRVNRNVPVEISVLFIGYRLLNQVVHMLPPRPPLSLDTIYQCTPEETCSFTERFGYFRHILRPAELPVGELLAAHLQPAQAAHSAAGDPTWIDRATQEVITLLRDDYSTLMVVLNAISDLRF